MYKEYSREKLSTPPPELSEKEKVTIKAYAEAPEGYKVVSVQEVETSKIPLKGREEPTGKGYEVTYAPIEYEVPTQLFGPKTEYYDPKTGVMKEELTTRQGKKIYVIVDPRLKGGKTASPHESTAISGLGLTTVVATGVTSPVLGVAGLGGVGVAETAKVTLTGKHLTPEEAIGAAGVAQLIVGGAMAGAKALQPRVQRSIDASYRQSVESQSLYKPSFLQRLGMKVTGAKQPSLAQEIVGAGEPRGVTLQMLKEGKTLGSEEAYFWDVPTPKSAQMYVRQAPRTSAWVETTLVKRVYLEGLFTLPVSTRVLVETKPELKPDMPHIPSAPAITRAINVLPSALRVAPFLAVASVPLEVTKSKRVQRLLQKQRTLQRQDLLQRTVQKEAEVQTQREEQAQDQVQQQIVRQQQQQSQRQLQRVNQVVQQKSVSVSPLIAKTTIAKAGLPVSAFGGSGGGARKRGGFNVGKWFFKRHPVATLQQNLRGVLGVKAKKPKSRKKGKRKKRGKR